MASTAGESARTTRAPKSEPHDIVKTSMSRALGLILLSTALFASSAQWGPFPWLAWIAMSPVFFLLRDSTPGRGFVLGGLLGWLEWFTSSWWLHSPLHDIVGMPQAGAIFFVIAGCALVALPYAVIGVVVCKWRRPGLAGAVFGAALLTVGITWGTPIFQGSIAHTQYRTPVVLQVLELGGTPLLLFLMLLVNWLVAEGAFLRLRQQQRPWKPLGIAAGIIATVLIYGGVRMQQFESQMRDANADQWVTIGAVQPNIPISVNNSRQPAPEALTNNFFTALSQGKKLAERHPEMDLIAFPENPATFLFNDDTARRNALGEMIRTTEKPVLLNADAVNPRTTNGIVERQNVALLLDTNRNLVAHYPKIKRVPMVEHLPGETFFPKLRNLFPKSLRVVRGPGPVVFHVKEGVRVIPVICYEATISAFNRLFVQKGGNVIVNQVNDSWFLRTPASKVHLSLALYRTVEFRVPMVRVTNSGIGAHIRADGRIVPGSQTELFTSTETAFPLYIPAERSIYARIGNWWMLGFLLLLYRSRSEAMT